MDILDRVSPDPECSPSTVLLPERARLLHIGLPKTGTTALQRAASSARAELLEAGVRYPGTRVNHLLAVSGFMGRRWGWPGPGHVVPGMDHWNRLMAEVEADQQRRIWLSHEFVSECDDEMAARFAEALGPRTHVVVTLRSFAAMLPSSWQQFVKSGSVHTFDGWLAKVLADPPDLRTTPSFHRRSDHGAVVDRWVRTLGPDHVTVVVLDRNRPELLTEAFSALLGLPEGILELRTDGHGTNRSMSAAEAELVRQVNKLIKATDVGWGEYERVLRNGAVSRMLANRSPGPDEGRSELPGWAAERALAMGNAFADRIAASGARVIGDLDVLREPVPSGPDTPPKVTSVPIGVAAQALAGAVVAAAGLPLDGVAPDRAPAEPRTKELNAVQATSGLTTRQVAQVLRLRVARRTRRALRHAGERVKGGQRD